MGLAPDRVGGKLDGPEGVSLTGSVGAGMAELTLGNVAAGWYAIYVGGTDHSLSGGLFDLSVHAVPEPTTAILLGAAGIWLCGASRRRARKG